MKVDGGDLLKRMREQRGYILPAHETLAERDPDFLDGYNRMFMAANSDTSPLPADVRELIIMALDVVAGLKAEVIRAHARKAVALGATEAQVVNAIELAAMVFASRNMSPLSTIFAKDSDSR